ncbi:MAG: hypothetical protein COW65_09060 [Cytophagales bacterium CG18_big_fil_WC_8_21_14_2_50_42_9]|nr:MAG: hypothetical protein COW65_09060 [Cytophagales bacterium CG18_big_fil_WC_8_21_14_2_50_42_9]
MKEAGLQTPELMNRNCIRGRESWVSKHIFVKPLTGKRLCVDTAGLDGRRAEHGSARSQDGRGGLPGEVSVCRVQREKSAAAIVAAWKRAVSTTEASLGSEEPNVKLSEIR